VGEAGVGKTRLLSELAAEVATRGTRVVLGRSYESAQILPFGPWVDAFRTSALLADDAVVGELNPAWRAELTRLFPELAASGLPAPSDDYLRLFESVTSLVARAASVQPLALLLEDVHWADEMSLRLLSFLGRRVHAWPVLLVTTARDEEIPDRPALRVALDELQRETHLSRLALSPLSRESVANLVRSLITERDAVTPELEENVWRMSQGNPFVASEIVSALRDASTPLPQRVREVTAARLERLSERGRRLTAVAAVIGRDFEFPLLARAAGLNESEAADGLEELVRRRVLHGAGERFDFVHDRVRDVAYAEVLPPRRRLLHAAIGAALEDVYASNVEPHYAALATHYRGGEAWDRAAVYCRHAGVQAAARSAIAEARTWLEQALDAVKNLPANRATLEEAIDIRLDLRSVLGQLVDYGGMMENLREAETLAGKLDDDRRSARVAAYMTQILVRFAQFDDARVAGARALAVARQLNDLELRLLATTFVGQIHHYCGEYEQQVEVITRNVGDLPREWTYKDFGIGVPISLFDRAQLVMSLAHLGRFREAAHYEAEGLELVEAIDHAYTVAQPHYAASCLRVLKGDWAAARSLAGRAVAALKTKNVAVLLTASVACAVWACAEMGVTSEAVSLLDEAESALASWRTRNVITGPRGTTEGWIHDMLGRAYLLLDRPDDARRLCERAIEVAPPGYAAYPLHLLGDIATYRERFDADSGEAHYREALALAEPRGMRPIVAHCHFGLGRLFQRTGRRVEAEQHLATAARMYRDMEMLFHLEGAESALRR
jgi:tetratricopeptide (TPR) repeat protein